MVDWIEGARWPLLAVAGLGLFFGALPLLWMLRRFGRKLFRRDQVPVGGGRYLMALTTGVVLVSVGLGALGLMLALHGYHSFAKKMHVAEVQCIELEPTKLRVYFVPIAPDGTRGATETYDVAGDEWTVGGDVLRFRPFLTALGVDTVYKLTRVEGRWVKAADANTHKATAFDRAGGTTRAWLRLYHDGTKGPLGWMIAGVHGQAVSQLPDRRAVYDLYVTRDGYVVDKRSL